MMSKHFHVYSNAQLPDGFQYPAALLELAAGAGQLNIYPWLFIDAPSQVGELSYAVRQMDGRNLVPFASVEDDRKDIACFDGNDTSGNPAVLMLILDDSGRSYSYTDFADWFKAAQVDAARWQA
jgi:hypothetical protein